MPQTCSICKHKDLEEINAALVAGETFRNIAEKCSVSITSLHRHKAHLPNGMVKAKEAQEVAKADTLLAQVGDLRDRAMGLLAKAERAGDLRTALQGVREAKGCLELLARLQGELQEQTTINILINPQWLSLRTVILQTLEPYPEARGKLAAALQEVEAHAGI